VTESRARDRALARARHGERLLAEIVAAIRDVVEPAEMLGAAAAAVSRAFAASACRIFRHAPERGFALALAAGSEAPPLELDVLAEQALRASATEPLAAAGALVALARYRHQVNGALCLWREGGDWSEDERRLAAAVASQLGIALEQIANHEALERLSFSDALTGLLNRRGFFAELGRRLPRLARAGGGGALFYVDLDNFKPVNDRFGHARGDEALCRVAELLRLGTRPGDLLGRLGGDEFALWLEGVDDEACRARAERLLALAVELAPLSGAADRPLGFSIGIAPLAAGAEIALAELTARADAAMYAVKHGEKGGFRIAAPDGRWA
jgi:diguanylate cyclase (GGDEF)-like protein